MYLPKILVTEDEAIVAMDIKQRLEHLDFEVTATVATGAAAIEAIESNQPDLVLMDIQIKGDIDGIETAVQIRKRFNIPIVFLTANSDAATIARAKATGPLAYLIKPFEDRELKAALEIAIYRHHLECKLTDQTELWHTTLKSVGDAVITTDTKGMVRFLNPAAERLTQWKWEEAIGLPLERIYSLKNEETGFSRNNSVPYALASGQVANVSTPTSLIRRDGSLLPIDDTVAPILSKQNAVTGAVLVFHDVSERRNREHKAREHQDQLEKAVWKRTQELTTVNEQLRQEMVEREKAVEERLELQEQLEQAERMRTIGLLAGGVAHDLNNMLGPLVGYPELILDMLPPESPVRKQVLSIAKAAKDAASVVQDLLTLARTSRYAMTTISVNQVITEYLESISFESVAQEHTEIKVETDLESDLPNIMGSSPHMSKVIMNLIVNALDSMEGNGTLTIKTQHKQVDQLISGYRLREPGEYVLLSVRDTGCGIEPENMERVFEPYYSNKEVKKRSGSGLGLSVVYGIIKDHKGYYDIKSEVGNGTEFNLYFPVTRKSSTQSDVSGTVSGGDETILVVDDDPGQRELAEACLSAFGYKVMLASNGTEAVKLLQTCPVDLVLLDMIMEDGVDGLDTYREILKLYAKQKAIIISGFSSTDRVNEARRLGAGAYLKKPFESKALAGAVRSELDRSPLPVAP